MHIFLFIFLFLFLIVAIVGGVVIRILRLLFGFKPRSPFASGSESRTYRDPRSAGQTHTTDRHDRPGAETASGEGRRKIFARDEGEYVDFEEVKD